MQVPGGRPGSSNATYVDRRYYYVCLQVNKSWSKGKREDIYWVSSDLVEKEESDMLSDIEEEEKMTNVSLPASLAQYIQTPNLFTEMICRRFF